jgi:hypothetical protein
MPDDSPMAARNNCVSQYGGKSWVLKNRLYGQNRSKYNMPNWGYLISARNTIELRHLLPSGKLNLMKYRKCYHGYHPRLVVHDEIKGLVHPRVRLMADLFSCLFLLLRRRGIRARSLRISLSHFRWNCASGRGTVRKREPMRN